MFLYYLLQLANTTVGSWRRERGKILHLPFLGLGTWFPAELLTQTVILVSLVEESINRDKRKKIGETIATVFVNSSKSFLAISSLSNY